VVDQAVEDDPQAALAEWGGQFRGDIESFLTREAVEGALRNGLLELPKLPGLGYRAFCDPSGGGQDEFALALGHREGARYVVDLLRARRGVPAEIAAEFAALLKSYGITRVHGDLGAAAARHSLRGRSRPQV
jgi:hypothetical protein